MRLYQRGLRAITLATAIAFTTIQPVQMLSQEVTTDYDHSADFSQFHTFCFGHVHSSDPLFEQRIRDEVTRDLTKRGWQMVSSGGDVTVTAVGAVKNQQEYNTFYDGLGGFGWRRGWGGGGFGETYTTVNQIPVGTLVIDLYQTGSQRLLFRGTANDQLSNNADKNTGKLDKAIDKIFSKLPVKSVG